MLTFRFPTSWASLILPRPAPVWRESLVDWCLDKALLYLQGAECKVVVQNYYILFWVQKESGTFLFTEITKSYHWLTLNNYMSAAFIFIEIQLELVQINKLWNAYLLEYFPSILS